MNTVQEREAEEEKQRYRAQLQKKAFPTIGTVYSMHQGLNREERRAMKYKPAPRKYVRELQQNIAFA